MLLMTDVSRKPQEGVELSMSDVFNRPTVFTSALAPHKSRKMQKGGRELPSDARPKAHTGYESESLSDSANQPVGDAGATDGFARGQGPSLRHQTRTIKRAQLLKKGQPNGPALPVQWLTIGNYLRDHFLAQPVCVLTHAGRFSGTLTEVTTDGIVLTQENADSCTLQFRHILSVGHLP